MIEVVCIVNYTSWTSEGGYQEDISSLGHPHSPSLAWSSEGACTWCAWWGDAAGMLVVRVMSEEEQWMWGWGAGYYGLAINMRMGMSVSDLSSSWLLLKELLPLLLPLPLRALYPLVPLVLALLPLRALYPLLPLVRALLLCCCAPLLLLGELWR